MVYREITARSALTKSRIPGADYCLNPYVGCAHACVYCYAEFMRAYSGHTEAWGAFVDVKANITGLLEREAARKAPGRVMVSSVTDPYQPIEAKRKLTRQCLEVLREARFTVGILTKSPLVTRDIDIFERFDDIEVGMSITTDDERIRKAFEPLAPPIGARLRALRELKARGIRTYAFVGPVLPMGPEKLATSLRGAADSIVISRMNYLDKSKHVYRRLGLAKWLDPKFTAAIVKRIRESYEGIAEEA